MIHTAKIYLSGVINSPLAETTFQAPDDATEQEILTIAGKAIGDRIHLEVTPINATQNSVKKRR